MAALNWIRTDYRSFTEDGSFTIKPDDSVPGLTYVLLDERFSTPDWARVMDRSSYIGLLEHVAEQQIVVEELHARIAARRAANSVCPRCGGGDSMDSCPACMGTGKEL